MPWRERFLALARDARDAILPPGPPVVVVEAGVPQGWEALTGSGGAVVCLERFGVSGKGAEVQSALGFDAAHIAAVARDVTWTQAGAGAPR
jgi:transketolase